MIKNVLIAFAVTFVVAAGLVYLDILGGSSSTTTFITPVVLGGVTFLVLQGLSGNRKEVRVDDANRQSSLSAPAAKARFFGTNR
jgi:hypothetical protein